MDIIEIILAVIIAIVAILYLITKSKLGKVASALVEKGNEFSQYKTKTEHLKQYEAIDDIR